MISIESELIAQKSKEMKQLIESNITKNEEGVKLELSYIDTDDVVFRIKKIREILPSAVMNYNILILNLLTVYGYGITSLVWRDSTIARDFSDTPIESRTRQLALSKCLTTLKVLRRLDLGWNHLKKEDILAIVEGIKFTTTLEELVLDWTNFEPPQAQVIGEWIKSNTTLTYLNLQGNHLGDEGCETLAMSLKSNASLRRLNLSANCIGDKGCGKFAKALKSNTALTYLDLSLNPIGDKGCEKFAKTLKSNHSLTKLDLSSNHRIGNKGAEALAKGLKFNHSLKELNLHYTGVDGITAQSVIDKSSVLVKEQGGNRIIQRLLVNWWKYRNGAIKFIWERLSDATNEEGDNVVRFNLKRNDYLKDEQIVSICDTLQECDYGISSLDFSTSWYGLFGICEIGDKGAKAIASLLQSNHSIRYLSLKSTSLTTPSVIEVFKGIQHNNSLQVLDLRRNPELYSADETGKQTILNAVTAVQMHPEPHSLVSVLVHDATFQTDAGTARLGLDEILEKEINGMLSGNRRFVEKNKHDVLFPRLFKIGNSFLPDTLWHIVVDCLVGTNTYPTVKASFTFESTLAPKTVHAAEEEKTRREMVAIHFNSNSSSSCSLSPRSINPTSPTESSSDSAKGLEEEPLQPSLQAFEDQLIGDNEPTQAEIFARIAQTHLESTRALCGPVHEENKEMQELIWSAIKNSGANRTSHTYNSAADTKGTDEDRRITRAICLSTVSSSVLTPPASSIQTEGTTTKELNVTSSSISQEQLRERRLIWMKRQQEKHVSIIDPRNETFKPSIP